MDPKPYWDAFITLFIVFDSIGNVPIFYSLTKDIDEKKRLKIFYKSLAIAFILLTFFMFFGYGFLEYYGVTMQDFQIAGGLLLLLLAIEGVMGKTEAEQIKTEDIAVVPMATPLLAGPGSIYVVMYLNEIYGPAPTLFSIIVNTLIALIVLKYSQQILTKAGKNLILVISKLFALMLAVIAVAMIRDGIEQAIRNIS